MNTKHIDFEKMNKIHFIGIGGISMSALAKIVMTRGISVSGSDRQVSDITRQLEKAGANIIYEQTGKNITDDIDMVVYTAAISKDNEELRRAIEKNIPVMVRADFLGMLMKEYETAVCVAGTHGKTTTTSMLAHILMEGEKDPTILVGGILDSIGGNLRIGHSQNFVTEACEYTNSFLSFFPTTAIVLNVSEDHLDFFKDINDIRHSFKRFIDLVPDDGLVILNGDITEPEYFTSGLKCKVITIGRNAEKNNISAANITMDDMARCSYDLMVNGEKKGHISLSVTGEHNVYNSLAAIAAAIDMGVDIEAIAAGLKGYVGTERRFEYKGEFNGVTVIDDYAHHPEEIKATLDAAENYPHKDIWVVFQPHTYSRTKALLNEFGEALSKADHVVLAEIYAAREKDTLGISSKNVADKVAAYGTDVYYLKTFDEIENFLKKSCTQGDLLITMGAGDVVNIGNDLVK